MAENETFRIVVDVYYTSLHINRKRAHGKQKEFDHAVQRRLATGKKVRYKFFHS
jgi:hypothetical protein